MKKTIVVFILCLLITGCTTTDQVRAKNRLNLLKLSVGITKEEVLNIMGTETIKTYDYGGPTINNPYRNEILQGKDKTFEVLYYYTDKKNDIGYYGVIITDDELTPLVFDDGKLIGWGWLFVQENIQKYEIRLR